MNVSKDMYAHLWKNRSGGLCSVCVAVRVLQCVCFSVRYNIPPGHAHVNLLTHFLMSATCVLHRHLKGDWDMTINLGSSAARGYMFQRVSSNDISRLLLRNKAGQQATLASNVTRLSHVPILTLAGADQIFGVFCGALRSRRVKRG